MSTDKMEGRWDCPCGKGQIVANWEERDTDGVYQKNKYATWYFECADCESRYEFGHTAIFDKTTCAVVMKLPRPKSLD